MPARTKPTRVRYQPKPVQPGPGPGRTSQVHCSARSENDPARTMTRSRLARSVPGRARASSSSLASGWPSLGEPEPASQGRLILARARAGLAELGPRHSRAVKPDQSQGSARTGPAAPGQARPGAGGQPRQARARPRNPSKARTKNERQQVPDRITPSRKF